MEWRRLLGSRSAVGSIGKAEATTIPLERLQFLAGISTGKLLWLLRRHGFRVARGRRRDLGQLFFVSLCAGLCNLGDSIRFGRRLRPAAVPPPLFIVGHWRTGTTLLHKLISLDPALHAPSFFECCVPRGFVSGAGWLKARVARNLPPERPFDSAPFGVDEPFEDEFVMAKEALVSPMLESVFPGSLDYRRHLVPDSLPEAERCAWERALMDFTRRLTLAHGRRLLLKSPAHSFRIPQLCRLFPGAKFIVLRRAPHDVIASTLKTEALLIQHNALRDMGSRPDELWINRRYQLLHKALDEGLRSLPAGDVAEIGYEELCHDPAAAIAKLYSELGLTDTSERRQALADYHHTQPWHHGMRRDATADPQRRVRSLRETS